MRNFLIGVAILAGVILAALQLPADAAPKRASGAIVTCAEPMTSIEAFNTRTAPCEAPTEGSLTPGATYVTTLPGGSRVKFLWESTQTGYILGPFALYGKRVVRTGTTWVVR